MAPTGPVLGAAETREFPARSGGTLSLELEAGGTVVVRGDGGSSIHVSYTKECTPPCEVEFEEGRAGLLIRSRHLGERGNRNSDIDIQVRVPRQFDVKLDSVGGGLTIDGVEGRFSGTTKGGPLVLNDVRGEAALTTMGGPIKLTRSELDGTLKTMGGEVRFEDVIGDVQGSSMGGNVRYRNVQRRDGKLGSPARTGGAELNETTADTVQISTMGGAIEVEDAPDGADVHTMGGDIQIRDAARFVRAKTMGGDIRIDSVDGWVEAETMAGDVFVTVTGGGGAVELSSNSGDITLHVPAGFGMELELEVAFTRNSKQAYGIEAPGGGASTTTGDWDHDHGTPRKFTRRSGTVNGGGNKVQIRTINGSITVSEGR